MFLETKYICGSGSVVERHLAKVNVASSNLVFRSINTQKTLSASFVSYKVPLPSGKATVCKTVIPQFKSGWHLQKIRQSIDCLIFIQSEGLAWHHPQGCMESVALRLYGITHQRAFAFGLIPYRLWRIPSNTSC